MAQLDLFSDSNNEFEIIQIQDGEYIYVPNFFSKDESDLYFKMLLNEINWKQQAINMYGKSINFPRLTALYGDNDKPYSFSGIVLESESWIQPLLEIKQLIETKSSKVFNSVLLNLYRNGNDSISWHTDAEKELGRNPIIASVNFGATRKFQLRHNETNEKIELSLSHGSLLIMQGELQHYWQHQVPKTKQLVKERINLTFRLIK